MCKSSVDPHGEECTLYQSHMNGKNTQVVSFVWHGVMCLQSYSGEAQIGGSQI
jgi:hypothetical protein